MITNDLRQPSLLLSYADTTILDAETQRSYLDDPRMGPEMGPRASGARNCSCQPCCSTRPNHPRARSSSSGAMAVC